MAHVRVLLFVCMEKGEILHMYSAACVSLRPRFSALHNPHDHRMLSVCSDFRSTCGALPLLPRAHTGRRLTTMLLYTIYINAAVNVRITLNVLKQRHCLSRGLERATNFLLGHQRA